MTGASSEVPPEVQAPPRGPALSPFALAIATGVLVVATYLLGGGLVQPINVALGIWWTELFAFFGVSVVAIRRSGRVAHRYLHADFPGSRAVALAIAASLVNYLAVTIPLQWAVEKIVPASWKLSAERLADVLGNQRGWELALIIAGVSIAAPIGEEVFFRGVLQQGLMRRTRTVPAIAITAVIFSALHLDPMGFPARVELGVLFGVLFAMGGSLWLGIAAHAAHNFASSLTFLALQEHESVDKSEPSKWIMIGLFVFGVPAVVSLARAAIARSTKPALDAQANEIEVALPRRRLFFEVTAWILGAILGVLLMLRIDPHGFRLTVFDAQHPLPTLETPSAADKARLESLRELRERARHDRAPLEAYETARKRLAEELSHSKR